MLCKASQIFFHVLIPNAVYHLAFPAIEDELSGDRAVAVLGLGAFLLVDQMAILLRDSFFAVLDLENPAGACLRVKHHHVKFAHGELQALVRSIIGIERNAEAPQRHPYLRRTAASILPHNTGFEAPPQQLRPLPAVPVPVRRPQFVCEVSSASNRSSFPKTHAGCSIPCSSARWPCIPELPPPIGFAGIHPERQGCLPFARPIFQFLKQLRLSYLRFGILSHRSGGNARREVIECLQSVCTYYHKLEYFA